MGIEPWRPRRQLLFYQKLAVVIVPIPIGFAVAPMHIQSHPVQLQMTGTVVVTDRYAEVVVLRGGLEVVFKRLAFPRAPDAAVAIGNVVVGLGAQLEIGGQVAFEGKGIADGHAEALTAAQEGGCDEQWEAEDAPGKRDVMHD